MNIKCWFKHDWAAHRCLPLEDRWREVETIRGLAGFVGAASLLSSIVLFTVFWPVKGPPWEAPAVSVAVFVVSVVVFSWTFRADVDATCLRCGKHVYNYSKLKVTLEQKKADEALAKEARKAKKAARAAAKKRALRDHEAGRLEALDRWLR